MRYSQGLLRRLLNILFSFVCLTHLLSDFPHYVGAIETSTGHNNFRFTSYSVEQGLSHPVVQGIAQDKQGFMWFGTKDGLNRFDGYSFLVFRHDPQNQNSLSDNEIRHLIVDKTGIIWIGTLLGGLNSYDPVTATFTRYFHDPNNSASIIDNHVEHILEDSSGNIWVGTAKGGAHRYDSTTDSFIRYGEKNKTIKGLPESTIISMAEDNFGNIWIGTDAPYPGLHRLNPKTGDFVHHYHNPEDPKSLSKAVNVRLIFNDSRGRLWIGTHFGGLDQYDRAANSFKHITHYPNKVVSSAVEDRYGHIWFTSNNGLVKYDRNQDSFEVFSHDKTDPRSISGNTTIRLFQDSSGLIWVGTFGRGVNVFSPGPSKFAQLDKDESIVNHYGDSNIRGIHVESNGLVWLGGWNGSLTRLNSSSGETIVYRNDPDDPASISPGNRLRAIYVDNSGTLWCGNWNNGLDRHDIETNTFKHYRHQPDNINTLSTNQVSSIIEDSRGNLWIGTVNGGLNKLDPTRQVISRISVSGQTTNPLEKQTILTIYENRDGHLWIGSWSGGLYRYTPSSNALRNFTHDPQDLASLAADKVFAIAELGNDLWIGTARGLCLYNRNTSTFTCYSTKDGLPSNLIYGVVADESTQSLWMSTSNGLSRFSLESKTFKNYDVSDGLQDSVFNPGSYFKSDSGELYFGGINGVNYFRPENVHESDFIPPIVLTDFKLFNTSIQVNDNSILQKTISYTDNLPLSYKDSVISFSFSSLAYAAPYKNKYRYMMEGVDTKWNQVDSTRRFATYTTLSPGEYTFHVRGTNSDGVWNETGASVNISVSSPFWVTWWFMLGGISVFTFILYGLYQMRTSRMRRYNLQLQNINDDLSAEIAFRKRAEKEMANLRTLLKNIIDSMPSSIIAVNNNGQVTQWNKEAENITGVRAENAMNRKLDDVFPLITDRLKNVHEALENRAPQKITNVTWQERDITHYSDLTIYPLVSNGSNGAVLRVDDITDRVNAENERQELQSRLQQSQKMEAIGTLAGGIAHDFNNILSAIIGFSELLSLRTIEDQKAKSYLQQILKASERAKQLVQQILTFSRQTKQEIKPIYLDEIAKDALQLLRATLPTNIEIQQKIDKGLLVAGDATQLHQIFMNLCGNAGHAMEEKGGVLKIQLSKKTSLQQSTIEVIISDTGHGISPTIIERIFDPFFTTKEQSKGTGMGLSVVHGVIKNHNGTIDVSSEVNKGTTFHITLPCLQTDTKSAISNDQEAPMGDEHILFVDDEEGLVEFGKELLSSLGYKVTAFSNSTQALESFAKQPEAFDLVITDMTMPLLMGDVLSQKLLEIRSDIPIILCTGFNPQITEEKALQIGIKKLLSKPLNRIILAKSIRTIIDSDEEAS